MLGKINDTVINLQAENAKLINETLLNNLNIAELNSLRNENQNLKNLVTNLKHENEKLIKEHGLFVESIEAKYIKEINRLKSDIQLQNDKCEFYNKLSVYVKNLEISNEELTHTIQNLKETHKNDLKTEYERNKIQCDEVKRKTLTFLSGVKKQANHIAYDNLSNNTKLNLLQLKQFKCELESQSVMVEHLLEKVDLQENQIKSLKLDLMTEKKIGKVLTNHNKKLTDMINNLLGELNILRENTFNHSNFENKHVRSSSSIYDSRTIPQSSTGKSFFKSYNGDDKSGNFGKNTSLYTLFKNSENKPVFIKNSEHKTKMKIKTILDAYDKQLQVESKISYIGSTLV
jgi:hypothetical protein